MPTDRLATLEHGSADWWVEKLGSALSKRLTDVLQQEKYYEGAHPLKFMTDRFRDAFGGMFRQFADNWCELVVDAVEERLSVQGFRFGEDPEADKDAWTIWQHNNMDAESKIAHIEALKHGVAYVLVEGDGRTPRITAEHPAQMIVAHEPGNRRRREAALKAWVEDDGHAVVTLWLPDSVLKYRSKGKVETGAKAWDSIGNNLEQTDEASNPVQVVPVVPIVNRPSIMRPWGKSEIANIIPTQDAVNKLVVDMMIAAHFAAFKQKWATGLEIPTNEDGTPVEAFKEAVDRVWTSAAPDTKFGEFEATDLSQYVQAIEMLVQHIASQTRTPPHYFFLRGSFPSGESIKTAETGLVAKSKDRMVHFGEAWEEAMRLAFAVGGDARANEIAAETIWGDPETRTESEMVDAAVKRKAIGVPDEQLWEDIGYTPSQTRRFEAMRLRSTLLTPVAATGASDAEPASAAGS